MTVLNYNELRKEFKQKQTRQKKTEENIKASEPRNIREDKSFNENKRQEYWQYLLKCE